MLPSNSIRARLTSMLIEVQQTDSPKTIEKFLASIRDMMTKLQGEQAKHQEISDSMMKQCQEEEAFRAKEITDAQDALDRANAGKAKCEASLTSAQKDLPDLQTALQTYEDELKRAVEQRDAENKTYLQRKTDYEAAIKFLNEFVAEVKSKLGNFQAFSPSFAQKSASILRHATKLGLLQHAVPVLVALATHQDEIPAHNSYKVVKQEEIASNLNKALTSLQARLQADWQNNEDVEAAAVAAFTQLKERLDHSINTLKENIAKTEKQIMDMEVCVKDESAVIATAGSKLSRNTNLKDSASAMCGQFAKEFIDATTARLSEIDTINEILAIIEKRFGQLPADLKTYLTSVEGGFKAYTNSTDFQKFVEYEKQRIADNDHGAHLAAKENHVQ